MSGILGLSFNGLELFVELEKRALVSQGLDTTRDDEDKNKIHRELRNLRWGMSYGKGGDDGGEGSAKRIKGIRPCFR